MEGLTLRQEGGLLAGLEGLEGLRVALVPERRGQGIDLHELPVQHQQPIGQELHALVHGAPEAPELVQIVAGLLQGLQRQLAPRLGRLLVGCPGVHLKAGLGTM